MTIVSVEKDYTHLKDFVVFLNGYSTVDLKNDTKEFYIFFLL